MIPAHRSPRPNTYLSIRGCRTRWGGQVALSGTLRNHHGPRWQSRAAKHAITTGHRIPGYTTSHPGCVRDRRQEFLPDLRLLTLDDVGHRRGNECVRSRSIHGRCDHHTPPLPEKTSSQVRPAISDRSLLLPSTIGFSSRGRRRRRRQRRNRARLRPRGSRVETPFRAGRKPVQQSGSDCMSVPVVTVLVWRRCATTIAFTRGRTPRAPCLRSDIATDGTRRYTSRGRETNRPPRNSTHCRPRPVSAARGCGTARRSRSRCCAPTPGPRPLVHGQAPRQADDQ